jgi:hypothetical protein
MGKGALISYAKSKNYLKKLELKHRQTPVSKIFQQINISAARETRPGKIFTISFVTSRSLVLDF